jgi:glycosyltransferase involved in cell wall biosynthesis
MKNALSRTSPPGTRPATSLPRVLVVGPGPTQIGGVTTFIQILISSPTVAEKYELIRLDTTRLPGHLGLESRFSLLNLRYLLVQTIQLIIVILRKRPYLMHLPVTSLWSFWKATAYILIGRMLGVKVVAHLHGGVFDQYYRQSSKQVKWLIGWSLSRADIVIALSRQWQRFLIEEVRPDLHVEIVRNTVDVMFAQALKQYRDSCNVCTNEVLFVGGLGQRKGVFDILQAVPIVRAIQPDVIFVFIGGEAARGDRDEIDRRCEEAGLEGAVRFLGPVTGLAKLQLFQRATLFILPSYGENLPYSLLEAMAVGLPVITTPVGAIPEIIEDGHHGFLIQPGDYATLARRIIQLLEDKSLRQRMGLANRLLIQNSYQPDVAMTQLIAIYDQLQGKNGTEIFSSSGDGGKDIPDCTRNTLRVGPGLQTKSGQEEESQVEKL